MDPISNSINSKIITECQMQEFQQILTMTSSVTSPSSTSSSTLREILVRSPEDGYLHPEVGIDEELERLLAEHPGLVMEDDKTTTAQIPIIKRYEMLY